MWGIILSNTILALLAGYLIRCIDPVIRNNPQEDFSFSEGLSLREEAIMAWSIIFTIALAVVVNFIVGGIYALFFV